MKGGLLVAHIAQLENSTHNDRQSGAMCEFVSVHIIVLVLVQIRSLCTELGSAQHRVVRLDIFPA